MDKEIIVLPNLKMEIERSLHECMVHFEQKCPYCGVDLFSQSVRNKYQKDHFIPVSKGGQDVPWNVLWSCKRCNYRKGNKPPDVFLNTDVFSKCSAFLENIKSRYIGEIQDKLEKFEQLKMVLDEVHRGNVAEADYPMVFTETFRILGLAYKRPMELAQDNKLRYILQDYFIPTTKDEFAITSTEISAVVTRVSGLSANPKKIGTLLKILGFKKKSIWIPSKGSPIKAWLCKPRNEDVSKAIREIQT